MRRTTALAAGAAAAVILGIGAGWMLSSKEPASGPEAKATERELTTGTVASRTAAAAAQPQAAQPQSFPPSAAPAPPQAKPAAGQPARVAAGRRCDNPDALGVSRTVAIDTAGGPGFGSEQFKAYDFLEPGEVVLTFDEVRGRAIRPRCWRHWRRNA